MKELNSSLAMACPIYLYTTDAPMKPHLAHLSCTITYILGLEVILHKARGQSLLYVRGEKPAYNWGSTIYLHWHYLLLLFLKTHLPSSHDYL